MAVPFVALPAFGSSEESPHPFTGYNKPPKHESTTLVGNWVEERALKDVTGTARYEPWVDQGEPTSIYTARQDQSALNMATHPRVIEHPTQTAPQNWKTMYDVSYRAPNAPAMLEYKSASSMLGPRARMELEAMRAMAADLPGDMDRTVTGGAAGGSFHVPTGDTTYQADFVDKDLTANKIGARCMRDHDGRPAVRDPTFLAETQIVPRALADRIFGESAQKAGATQTMQLPNPDVPITLYTESVATRKYGTHVYGTRPIAGAAAGPHAKYTNFSKPMSEYSKVVVDE